MTDKAKVLWVHLGTWTLVSSDLDILHDTMYQVKDMIDYSLKGSREFTPMPQIQIFNLRETLRIIL